jgi:hypothetical protein
MWNTCSVCGGRNDMYCVEYKQGELVSCGVLCSSCGNHDFWRRESGLTSEINDRPTTLPRTNRKIGIIKREEYYV